MRSLVPTLLVLFAFGCGSDGPRLGGDASAGDGGSQNPGDGGGQNTSDARTGRDVGNVGPDPDECADNARWIYLLDDDATLIRFEPDTRTLTPIGTLTCNVLGGTVRPFSMAVDRNATAWVLYQNGSLQRVSTMDASCEPTTYAAGQEGLTLFGMGFATDGPGSPSETLFVAGGGPLSVGGAFSTLGTIDLGAMSLSTVGALEDWPELTGTGAGDLFGFFPSADPPAVRQIEKGTAQILEDYPLSALGSENPHFWAFAFWGGRFYLFLAAFADPSSTIWRFEPASNALEPIVPDSGYNILGAGVSTCAPVELI